LEALFGQRVPLTRDTLADLAIGVGQLGAIGQEPQAVLTRRP
jgi:hypothetical protein